MVTGDFRLKDIVHTLPGNTLLSRHSYEYSAVGNITRWTQISPQAGLNRSWLCGYDNADQLTSVASQDPITLVNQPTGQYAYGYDPVGNRLSETIDSVTTTAHYNALNQLTGLEIGGVSIPPDQTYEWDAEDRLAAIHYTGTSKRSEFQYDGYSRRARVTELDGSTVTSDFRHLWNGLQLREERDATGSNVQERWFGRGMQRPESGNLVPLLVARDHLGSVREVVAGTASLTNAYDFDPWGRRLMRFGQSDESSLAFTGHWFHRPSLMNLTLSRAYYGEIGRWLSRDRLRNAEVIQGSNLYAYVNNNPILRIDPLGLWQFTFDFGAGLGGRFTFGYNCGQFNGGAYGGIGAGYSGSFDPNDSGYHDPGFDPGVITSVSAGVAGGFGANVTGTFDSQGGHIDGSGSFPTPGGFTNEITGTINVNQNGRVTFGHSNSASFGGQGGGISGVAGVGGKIYF